MHFDASDATVTMASYGEKEAFKFEKNDGFFFLKKLIIDFGSHKITMSVYFFGLIFLVTTYLLNIYFVFTHLSLEITKYFVEMAGWTYILTSMFFSIVLKKKFFGVLGLQQSFYWPYDSAGEEARKLIWSKNQMINKFTYFTLFCYVATVVSLMPFFGYLNQIFLSLVSYETYFNFFLAKICYFLYISLIPIALYSAFRPGYGVWYFIVQIRVQMFLISQHILQIENDFETMSDWEKIRNERYQEEMYRRLCYCMKQHASLKILIRQFSEGVFPTLIIYIIEGTLFFLCVLIHIIFRFKNDETINVVRLVFFVVISTLILISTCEAGQMLQDETGRIFEVLLDCPWYIWNIKVRKCLLFFLTNSLEDMKLSVAGVALDRRLIINLLKASYSYSMIFRNITREAA